MSLPANLTDLEKVKQECYSLVTKRASASGAAAVVPLPGADLGADVLILLEMIPAINRKFGLTPEQLDQLDSETKKMILVTITSIGSELIGKTITKQLVVQALKKVGVSVATKSVAKYIPILGSAVAAGISFGAMKYVGNSHVDECYEVAKRYLNK